MFKNNYPHKYLFNTFCIFSTKISLEKLRAWSLILILSYLSSSILSWNLLNFFTKSDTSSLSKNSQVTQSIDVSLRPHSLSQKTGTPEAMASIGAMPKSSLQAKINHLAF